MKPYVLLVTITAEMPRFYEYYDSLDRLILPPNTKKFAIHSSSPAINRNVAIRAALKHDFTHIFFTDDDNTFMPDTIGRLLSHEKDIVSGLYCRKFPPFELIAMNAPNKWKFSSWYDMTNVGPNELVEIPRIPAGCLLVTTECLKNIPPPWFTIGQIKPDEWGDDLYFCDKAYEAGYKIYIDTSVRVGHITKCILTPEYVNGEWIIKHQINSELGIEVMKAEDLIKAEV